MAFIGKTTLFVLTALALINLTALLIHGPPKRASGSSPVVKGCVHVMVAETRDSTVWQSDCAKPNVPWDTVVLVRSAP